ncbi:enoyl-CoA hydratase/isomerase family protein [Neptunomonas qingdaonensis]|uniref:3-hydroxyisobutyryl-CoA hydrolase n=1 Tax=Neptunomonas qingdaonensis TaxID=1045558 RepID=A0A1I2R127_9GAMM|nr:enoyl-CoA hydratase/isomerase family protein [Neptunomonas qingdaonensis]SFG33723.1 Enoyl-CoA hydratase/carnithine racemase [Neptunomonas qingdaonensis]
MSCVLFTEHLTQDGKKIIEICLNAEKSLNALTLDMINLIQPKLDAYKTDDSVVAILLDGTGEKAFCAGGDVVSLYKSMTGGGDADFPEQFFTSEYLLDYTIHTYPKPIICWGSGIVMGGGMGLLSGCSHRIVTETTHMAMPEVTIGLYPDVGGTWFLHRTPGRTGLFLGLTGNRMNATDALFLNLADRFLKTSQRADVLDRLTQETWEGDLNAVVSRVLRDLEDDAWDTRQSMESPVRTHFDLIQDITDQDTVEEIIETLLAVETDDKWMQRAQKAISHGSPLAIHMIYKQFQKTLHMSLKEVFESELVLSVQCCRHREFPEGVRALLVDKDGKPNWTFSSVSDVDPAFLSELFVSPWDTNPLAEM